MSVSKPSNQTTGTCRTSTFCQSGECVGVILPATGNITVKRVGPVTSRPISFTRSEWSAFIKGVKAGEFDL